MDSMSEQLDPERLYEIALGHFRAARWVEATNSLKQLQELGHNDSVVEDLLADIQLKQNLEQIQTPTGPPPPRNKVAGKVLAGLGGLALTAGLIWGGMQVLQAQPILPDLPIQQNAIVGTLPTAAPAIAAPPVAEVAGDGTLAVRSADAELALGIENVYIILDASGSMLASPNGERKIDIAQQALGSLVQELPDGANVALRTYGRLRPDDCSDVELVSGLGPLDRETLQAQINAIVPVNLSKTPIANSLAAVAADLGDNQGQTLVLLLSDGEENCDGDPVQAAAELRANRPELRVSVVGFDIAPELRARLAAIAAAGGGQYFDAGDVEQLAAALRQTVTPRFRVIDDTGREVAAGDLGSALTVPSGAYTVAIGDEQVLLEQTVEVRPGMATLVAVVSSNGQLSADVSRDWSP
ncbi:MAG: VWA domain-containing protein [Oscillochloris sp.]|nr:VWA domain-containing protein [Oscillochloris sp.]